MENSRKRVSINSLKDSELNIICHWKNCCFSCESRIKFYEHVKYHLPQLKIIVDKNGEESYECLWTNCIFETKDSEEVTWHVKYHGYHSILKALGNTLLKKLNLPSCTFLDILSNTIPPYKPLICLWDSCNEKCDGPIEFMNHVKVCHVRFYTGSAKNKVDCSWADCSFSTTKNSRLAEHIKVHTSDKAAACNHCGQTFANSTKFVDHFQRQAPIKEDSPACDHCLTSFPNKRLLRIHMRQHIQHYKCYFCDLTCITPSVLSAHIKYRHLPYKPFKCSLCNFSCKSQNDLTRHMTAHSNNKFTCSEEGCNASFRCTISLSRHYVKSHPGNDLPLKYSCHLCNKFYSKGADLTKHLNSAHSIVKPAGYYRFTYRQESDGCYRLQTSRLESLECVQEALKNPNLNSALEEDVDDPSETIIKGTDNSNFITSSDKPIAIDVLDAKGKIITSNVLTAPAALPTKAKVVAVG